ncbi:cytochrome P450 [Solimonas soli]|uniref:cytochrome P450 n=1 Tax=Solimonas soli TaxID=413479 RepID=UPI0004879D88|nr:cytochrome P450 [Solimonas soli]
MIPDLKQLDPAKFEHLDFDMYGQAIKSDPSKYFLKWAQQPPRYIRQDGHIHAFATRHKDVKFGLMNQEFISAVPVPGTGLDNIDYFNGLPIIVEVDPPQHTRLRRLMQPAFTPRRVAEAQAGLNALAHQMMDQLEARGSDIDVMADVAIPFAVTVLLGHFLAVPQQDWPLFLHYSHSMSLVGNLKAGEPKPKEYMDAYNAMYAYCEKLIEQRRVEPKDDLIGSIIDSDITTEELFATLMVLLTGGIGTISATIGLAALRFGRHPDQMELLRSDPSLINSAIEEVLRIDCLGNFRHRWAKKDFEFEGLQVWKGMPIALSLGAANYDPELYPNPEKFDIRRAPTDVSSFGYGIHFCIGQAIARPSVRTATLALIQRFPALRLATPDFEPLWGGLPTERSPVNVNMKIK